MVQKEEREREGGGDHVELESQGKENLKVGKCVI